MKDILTRYNRERGEIAIRSMSAKAQKCYYGSDCLKLYEYIDLDATAKLEQEAWDNDVDYFPGELDVIRYAIKFCSDPLISDFTFEEAQKYLEDLQDDE